MPGRRSRSLKNRPLYEKLREERGYSKTKAAKISNSRARAGKGSRRRSKR